MFEFFVDAVRMIDGDEAHLFGERKVEIDDAALRPIARPVIDITIRADIPPGMRTVYFLEFLIHIGAGMRMATGESLPQRRGKRDKLFASHLRRRFGESCFFASCFGESQTVLNAGKSSTLPSILKLSLPPKFAESVLMLI